jgi:hypothetical protein
MHAIRAILAFALTIPLSRAAPPAMRAELTRCAALATADERLACYDALNCATIAAADERLACYDALAKGKPAPPAAATAGVSGSDGPTGDASFGAPQIRSPPKPPPGPTQMQAVVAEVSVDRMGTVSVSLDNGQRWTFQDPDPRLRPGDRVTIRRAALGSFLMATPSRHIYRVQRTQ